MSDKELTPDEMVRVVMGDSKDIDPKDAEYLEDLKTQVEAEVREIYEQVKRELEAE